MNRQDTQAQSKNTVELCSTCLGFGYSLEGIVSNNIAVWGICKKCRGNGYV